MRIQNLAAFAEIVSSIAIVITLIYLTIQAQQTNRALLAASRQATMAAEIAMVGTMISNPEAWANTDKSFAELTFAEQEQVGNVLAGMLRVREYAWFQYENGILDEAAMESYLAPVARWLKRGDVIEYWKLFSPELDPEFVAYIDALLVDSP